MSFMVPFYSREDFLIVENTRGESRAFHADVALSSETLKRFRSRQETTNPKILDAVADYIEGTPAKVEFVRGKYWGHLSAPGYMDQTEWDGPHDTLEEAKESLADAYDCCPECGDEHDGDECPGEEN